MRDLTLSEIGFVSGGSKTAATDAGTLKRPTNGESEHGRLANDIAFALDAFGGWLGRTIYDLRHGK